MPVLLRQQAQKYESELPEVVHQALLDAANEIEGGEEAFAVIIDEKRELQRELVRTQSNLRGAYDSASAPKVITKNGF